MTIDARGATIVQTVPGKAIALNAYATKTKFAGEIPASRGKYNRCKNITINGGTWVGTYESNANVSKGKYGNCKAGYSNFQFQHGQNITIKNCTIKNNYNGHFIELVSVKNVKITNVKMSGKYVGDSTNEAIQIDTASSKSVAPTGAPFDKTPDVNVSTIKCNINVPTLPIGIGTSNTAKKTSSKLNISKNKIKVKSYGVTIARAKSVTVSKNTITAKKYGINVFNAKKVAVKSNKLHKRKLHVAKSAKQVKKSKDKHYKK